MATFYIDIENGSNYNSGDCPFGASYGAGAPLLSVTDGVTNGTTTLTSATGGFTAGMVGRTLMLWSTTTFRAYRTIAAYVSTNEVTMDTLLTAYTGLTVKVGGALASITGIKASMSAPGDVCKVAKSSNPTLVCNATWTNFSRTVVLATAQTATVDLCETAWTASANVTATASTTRKEGSYSSSLVVADAFTTGLVAYKTLTSIDLSAYQKCSFWFRNSLALASGCLKLCLCSDTLGVTIVDTFPIPAIPSTNYWLPLTITKSGGGNLGAAIQSVALYADTDPGIMSVYLDNIIACTTNGLNLQSLISKNSLAQGGSHGWYGMKSLEGVNIQLDNNVNSGAGSGAGYYGTTETVATYKRETVKTPLMTNNGDYVQEIQESGTSGSNIQFQGGYNTSDGVQSGETFFDGLNGLGYGLFAANKSYLTLNYFNFSRYWSGFYGSTIANMSVGSINNLNNCTSYAFYMNSCSLNIITNLCNLNHNGNTGLFLDTSNNNFINNLINCNSNAGSGFYSSGNNNIVVSSFNCCSNTSSGFALSSNYNNEVRGTITSIGNSVAGISVSGFGHTINDAVCNSNTTYGVVFNNSNNVYIKTLSTTGNTSGGISNFGTNYIRNSLIAEATEVITTSNYTNSKLFSDKHDQTIGNNWVFVEGGTCNSLATTRPGGTGIMWKLNVTSSVRDSYYTLTMPVARVAVTSGILTTVKVWMQKGNATTITGRLVCRGNQVGGVANDVVATKTNDLNWEQLTISFTPTENGVVEIEVEVYYVSGLSYIYVEDLSVT